jgi:hypothetical protein
VSIFARVKSAPVHVQCIPSHSKSALLSMSHPCSTGRSAPGVRTTRDESANGSEEFHVTYKWRPTNRQSVATIDEDANDRHEFNPKYNVRSRICRWAAEVHGAPEKSQEDAFEAISDCIDQCFEHSSDHQLLVYEWLAHDRAEVVKVNQENLWINELPKPSKSAALLDKFASVLCYCVYPFLFCPGHPSLYRPVGLACKKIADAIMPSWINRLQLHSLVSFIELSGSQVCRPFSNRNEGIELVGYQCPFLLRFSHGSISQFFRFDCGSWGRHLEKQLRQLIHAANTYAYQQRYRIRVQSNGPCLLSACPLSALALQREFVQRAYMADCPALEDLNPTG